MNLSFKNEGIVGAPRCLVYCKYWRRRKEEEKTSPMPCQMRYLLGTYQWLEMSHPDYWQQCLKCELAAYCSCSYISVEKMWLSDLVSEWVSEWLSQGPCHSPSKRQCLIELQKEYCVKTKVIALDWQWVTFRIGCQMNRNGHSSPVKP